jgi:hypothetical protein
MHCKTSEIAAFVVVRSVIVDLPANTSKSTYLEAPELYVFLPWKHPPYGTLTLRIRTGEKPIVSVLSKETSFPARTSVFLSPFVLFSRPCGNPLENFALN